MFASPSHRTVAVTLVAACLALPLASRLASAPQGPPPPTRPAWPPHASNIFNLDSKQLYPSNGYVQLPPNTTVSVYTVPSDRWLVLTDGGMSSRATLDLVEDAGGAITVKRATVWAATYQYGDPIEFHSSVGLAFAPGSNVSFRNQGTSNQLLQFTLTGYFAAP